MAMRGRCVLITLNRFVLSLWRRIYQHSIVAQFEDLQEVKGVHSSWSRALTACAPRPPPKSSCAMILQAFLKARLEPGVVFSVLGWLAPFNPSSDEALAGCIVDVGHDPGPSDIVALSRLAVLDGFSSSVRQNASAQVFFQVVNLVLEKRQLVSGRASAESVQVKFLRLRPCGDARVVLEVAEAGELNIGSWLTVGGFRAVMLSLTRWEECTPMPKLVIKEQYVY